MEKRSVVIAIIIIVSVAAITVGAYALTHDDEHFDITGTWHLASIDGYRQDGEYIHQSVELTEEYSQYDLILTSSGNAFYGTHLGTELVGSFDNGVFRIFHVFDDLNWNGVMIGTLYNEDTLAVVELIYSNDTGEYSAWLSAYTRGGDPIEFEESQKIEGNWKSYYSSAVGIVETIMLKGDNLIFTEQQSNSFKVKMDQNTDDKTGVVVKDAIGVHIPESVVKPLGYDLLMIDDTGRFWFGDIDDETIHLHSMLNYTTEEDHGVVALCHVYTRDGRYTELEIPSITLIGTKWKNVEMITTFNDGTIKNLKENYTLDFLRQSRELMAGIWEIDGKVGEFACNLNVSDNGVIGINIMTDYSYSMDSGYGWFSSDGKKMYLIETYSMLDETTGNTVTAVDFSIFEIIEDRLNSGWHP